MKLRTAERVVVIAAALIVAYAVLVGALIWLKPPPGAFVHEVGGARMGSDPAASVVDPRNRCWGMPNVLVTDGSCWPTCGWQGPTLTIMAVTARACSLAVEDLRRGDL